MVNDVATETMVGVHSASDDSLIARRLSLLHGFFSSFEWITWRKREKFHPLWMQTNRGKKHCRFNWSMKWKCRLKRSITHCISLWYIPVKWNVNVKSWQVFIIIMLSRVALSVNLLLRSAFEISNVGELCVCVCEWAFSTQTFQSFIYQLDRTVAIRHMINLEWCKIIVPAHTHWVC